MRISSETKEKILEMRRRGYSVPELSREFSISKSTASHYARLVQILPEWQNRWLERRNASRIISERNQKKAKENAKLLVGKLKEQDYILIMSVLYWAAGAKKDFSFSNSDPEMVRLLIYLLKKLFLVKDSDIKISIRVSEGLKIEECVKFWSRVTGIGWDESVNLNFLKGAKVGKLKYGMCRVRVKKAGLILKTIFAINKRVTELIFGGDLAEGLNVRKSGT